MKKYLLTYLNSKGYTDFCWFELIEEMESFINEGGITIIDKLKIDSYTKLG